MTVTALDPQQAKRGLPRWARFALVASLALNVLFVGTLLGALWRGGSGGMWGRSGGNIIAYVASLPADKREKLMQNSRELRQQIRPLRETARQAARDRVAALSTEPFDKARYLEAQTRQIDAETKVRMLMRDVVADAAANMTLDERKAFLRWRGPRNAPMHDDDGLERPAGKAK